ncbi:MAG: hypothetical protein JRC99_10380, partial [Deltaproteobacteria bacterium]|nr:hypothetical protein [Deltaproteobacteria bacterium]
MAVSVWKPPEIEDELDGMVASLAVTHPSAAIDKLDLKVINTYGDWFRTGDIGTEDEDHYFYIVDRINWFPS